MQVFKFFAEWLSKDDVVVVDATGNAADVAAVSGRM
jgi:hypothetical protein